jgi:hypothetical protein
MVELISDDSFVGVLLYIENLLKINFELENWAWMNEWILEGDPEGSSN